MKGTLNPVWDTMVEILVADFTQVCSHLTDLNLLSLLRPVLN